MENYRTDTVDLDQEWYFVPRNKIIARPPYQFKEEVSDIFFIITRIIQNLQDYDIELVLGIVESGFREEIFQEIHTSMELEYFRRSSLPRRENQMIENSKHYIKIGIFPAQKTGFIIQRTKVMSFGKKFRLIPNFLSYLTRIHHFPEGELLRFSGEILRLGLSEEYLREISSEITREVSKNLGR